MKKEGFQIIVSALIWVLMFIPFWLPDSITGQVDHEPTISLWVEIWVGITLFVMITLSWIKLWEITGRLYDWLKK